MTFEGRTFVFLGEASKGFILDNNFDFDAGMQLSGDFLEGEKEQYAKMIINALNEYPSLVKDRERLQFAISECRVLEQERNEALRRIEILEKALDEKTKT
jgi:hypothetical protein